MVHRDGPLASVPPRAVGQDLVLELLKVSVVHLCAGVKLIILNVMALL